MTAYTARYTDATSIYTKAGLTATQLDVTTNDSQLIREAESELETLTGRKFTSSTAITEYISAQAKDTLGYSGTSVTSVKVQNYPILSVTSLIVLNLDGTANTTYDTLSTAEIAAGTYENADYWAETQFDPVSQAVICNGKFTLKTATFPTGKNNVKVGYTYGYASVPETVKDLATCLGAMRMWISFMGGQYNRLDSYSIPQQSVSKGDFYARGMKMIELLQLEAERLLDRIGRKPRTLLFTSSGER